MLKEVIRTSLVAACFSLMASTAGAQAMIHALSGTVISTNPKTRMIEINTDDGSSGQFRWPGKSGADVDFDKNVKSDATAVDQFTTTGTHVIVYYFGDGEVRTAVALRDLGDTPFKEIRGTVLKLSRHDHQLTIKDSSGAEVSFSLDPKTVGDTATGVTQNFKYDFDKGAPVRVTAKQANGTEAAVLIAPYM